MQTILLFILIIVGSLIFLSFIPGIKEVVRPILAGIGNLVLWCFKESSEWIIYFIKELVLAHTGFFHHLVTDREEFIPEEKIKRMSKDSRSKVNKLG